MNTTDPMLIPLRDALDLPPGWTATAFFNYTELRHDDGRVTHVPHPYDPQPHPWLKDQAAQAIALVTPAAKPPKVVSLWPHA